MVKSSSCLGVFLLSFVSACAGQDVSCLSDDQVSCGLVAPAYQAGHIDELADEPAIGSAGEAITNGTLVSGTQPQPAEIGSVVFLNNFCTATKIPAPAGVASRFLTAAHCAKSLHPGQTLVIGNEAQGPTTTGNGSGPPGKALTFTQVYIHPSFASDPAAIRAGTNDPLGNSYDVAIIDSSTGTGTIPFDAVYTTLVADNDARAAKAVGYGIDAVNSTHQYQKQLWANLRVSGSQAGSAAEVHYILSQETGSGARQIRQGDSGGPLLRLSTSNVWQVMGVNAFFSSDTTTSYSYFTRLSNVADWLANPHNVSVTPAAAELVYMQSRNADTSVSSALFGFCVTPKAILSSFPVIYGQCEKNNQDSNRWEMIAMPGGFFRFHNLSTFVGALCLDTNGTQAIVSSCSATVLTQQWNVFAQGVGGPENGMYFKIVNRANGKALDENPSGRTTDPIIMGNPAFSGTQDFMLYR